MSIAKSLSMGGETSETGDVWCVTDGVPPMVSGHGWRRCQDAEHLQMSRHFLV